MIQKFINHINDKNKAYVIFDIGSRDCQQSIEFYKTFPNAKIYAFECNPNTLDLCEQNIIPYQDRITLIKGCVCDYYGDIEICYMNNNDFKFIENKIALNRVKLLVNSSKILFNNLNSNLEMFCVYHKKYYFREDNFYFTFFGVNEVYSKEKTCNNVLEYELDNYNPFLQKRGYMETSVYLHVYWNKLYKTKDMVGFSQYDMKHSQKYDNLDKKTIYLLNTNKPIVKDGKWEAAMFSKIRNLDFLIKSYNAHFDKKYTMKELENKPLSLWQTNIYPVTTYEKLCGWLEKLVDEIYPWSNQLPYETHFGSIGGYTERALSIFNAFEIHEGTPYSNLSIQHGVGSEVKEQYNHKSFLNNYSQDVHCKIVEQTHDTKDYCIVGTDNQENVIIKENKNNITQLFYIDEKKNRSKPLMILGNSNDNTFKWKHNILDCNLDNYEIYYKKKNYYRYDIIVKCIISKNIIPRDIILTWKDNNIPPYVIQKWKTLNPDYNIKFFNDNDIINFLDIEYSNKFSNFFKEIPFGRYKADFFRLCYLYKYGGYYFDIDIEPISSIDRIINNKYTFISCLSLFSGHIFQAILITTKNNPIIKLCIDSMLYYGSNIGINPPDHPPYNGHPTKCMFDNIQQYTNSKIKEGNINYNEQNILLGKEIKYKNRTAIQINDEIFGYSRYTNYDRKNGFI